MQTQSPARSLAGLLCWVFRCRFSVSRAREARRAPKRAPKPTNTAKQAEQQQQQQEQHQKQQQQTAGVCEAEALCARCGAASVSVRVYPPPAEALAVQEELYAVQPPLASLDREARSPYGPAAGEDCASGATSDEDAGRGGYLVD